MKISELRELLATFPQDAEVHYEDAYFSGSYEAAESHEFKMERLGGKRVLMIQSPPQGEEPE